MKLHKIDSYFSILGESQDYAQIFSRANVIYKNQLTFKQLIPKQLAPYCTIGQINAGKLTVLVDNSAIASKLKQILPSLLVKLQQRGWEVTSFQISVQANHAAFNTKKSVTNGNKEKKIKLSETGKKYLNQLATSLPNTELSEAIRSFVRKHQTD